MSWSSQKTLRFIELYKEKTVLWDAVVPDKKAQFDAWGELAKAMEASVKDCKQRWELLDKRFKQEEEKIKTKLEDNGEVYESRWFAYDRLLFLKKEKEHSSTVEKEQSSPTVNVEEPIQEGISDDEVVPTPDVPSPKESVPNGKMSISPVPSSQEETVLDDENVPLSCESNSKEENVCHLDKNVERQSISSVSISKEENDIFDEDLKKVQISVSSPKEEKDCIHDDRKMKMSYASVLRSKDTSSTMSTTSPVPNPEEEKDIPDEIKEIQTSSVPTSQIKDAKQDQEQDYSSINNLTTRWLEEECTNFGKFIGNKLRKLRTNVRVTTQNCIYTILYNAELGVYDPPIISEESKLQYLELKAKVAEHLGEAPSPPPRSPPSYKSYVSYASKNSSVTDDASKKTSILDDASKSSSVPR